MMTRILFTSVALALVLFPEISLAGISKGVVAQWAGFYTQDACATAGPPDLPVPCPLATHGIAFTKAVFFYLEGICDDSGVNQPTPCAGRFTSLAEEVGGPSASPSGSDITVSGPIQSTLSRGLNRVCYGPAAAWDCTGATPVGAVVIGTGKTLTQTRHVPGASASGVPAQATSEVIKLTTKSFKDNLDGKRKRLNFRTTIAHITAEPNSGCGLSRAASPGCGLAGTSVLHR